MDFHRPLLVSGICVAGLIVGSLAKRIRTEGHINGEQIEPAPLRSTDAKRVERRNIDPLPGRSNDTLESIQSVSLEHSYARIALWMLDATDSEIAIYYQFFKRTHPQPRRIKDLIFTNWTRLNPQAAIEATFGTDDEYAPWLAWSSHSPEAALAAVLMQNRRQLEVVASSIGEFHPDWTMRHLDEIPIDQRHNAIGGVARCDGIEDPEQTLKFLYENEAGFGAQIFQVMMRRDPTVALRWAKQNRFWTESYKNGQPTSALIQLTDHLAQNQPDLLQQFAEKEAPGKAKRDFEARLFNQLIESDLEQARQQALATTAPRVALERTAAVVRNLLADDPDLAFSTMENFLTKHTAALDQEPSVLHPSGTMTLSDGATGEAERLLKAMIATDPQRTLDLWNHGERIIPHSSGFSDAARIWASQNLTEYTRWIDRQTDPQVIESTSTLAIQQMQSRGNYSDAAEWILDRSPAIGSQLPGLLSAWGRKEPEQALQWLESSGLRENEIRNYENLIVPNP